MFSFFGSKKSIDIQKEKRNVANLALGIASIMFFTLIAQIIVINVVAIVAPNLLSSNVALMFINAISMYGIAMPASMIFFKNCETLPIRGKRIGFGTMLLVIAACFGLMYVGSIVGSIMDELSAELLGSTPSNPVADTVSTIPLWSTLLFVVILAPVFEEIFFRRVVIDRLRRYGDIPAIILSGLAFGLIHGNFSQFFYATFLGMLFGAVYIHTGKLGHTIFLHMLINFMGSFYTMVMMERFGGEIPLEMTAEVIERYPEGYLMMSFYSTLYVISLILTIPALLYFARKIKLQKGVVMLDDQQSRRVTFGNLGVWLAVIFLVGNFALSLLLS